MAGTWWLVRCHLRWAALVPLVLIVALGATGTLIAAGDRTEVVPVVVEVEVAVPRLRPAGW